VATHHPNRDLSDYIAEFILQLLWWVFYFSFALPVGAIGRLLPSSAYYRAVAQGKVPTDNPRTWAIGGVLVLFGLGLICYLLWQWIGLSIVLAIAAIVIFFGWRGTFEEYKKRERKPAQRSSSSKARTGKTKKVQERTDV
jgi:hypothetical protein